MANRYWVGGTNTWDNNAGTKWATTSGGTGGASVPSGLDDVFFDANSGSGVCTTDGYPYCNKLNCTGYTGTLNIASGGFLIAASDITFSSEMTLGADSTIGIWADSGTCSITTNGKVINSMLTDSVTLTLQDDLNCGYISIGLSTIFDANDKNVYTDAIEIPAGYYQTIYMGSGTWNISGESSAQYALFIGSAVTIYSETSTLKFHGNPTKSVIFYTASAYTFNDIWISDTNGYEFVSAGDFTCNNLKISSGITCRFNGGTNTSVSSLDIVGTSGNEVSLLDCYVEPGGLVYTVTGSCITDTILNQGSGYTNGDILTVDGGNNDCTFLYSYDGIESYFFRQTVGSGYTPGVYNLTGGTGTGATIEIYTVYTPSTWTLTDISGTNNVEYCNIKWSETTGGATFNALNSVDLGNNSGWIFPSGVNTGAFFQFLI